MNTKYSERMIGFSLESVSHLFTRVHIESITQFIHWSMNSMLLREAFTCTIKISLYKVPCSPFQIINRFTCAHGAIQIRIEKMQICAVFWMMKLNMEFDQNIEISSPNSAIYEFLVQTIKRNWTELITSFSFRHTGCLI